jgi:CBS domain containing-hemolysin-like protein
MQVKLNEGGKMGAILKDFKENIDRPLAGILTINTIAHTAGAIGVGQEATKIWGETHPFITGLVIPVAMTFAILIFSEIIPKTLGATNWKFFAPFTAYSLNIILKVFAPIIWFCQLITKLFNRNKESHIFSRTDFLALAQIGSEEGKLDETETKFIHNMLHFKNYKAHSIMTPRPVILSAPQDMTTSEFYEKHNQSSFSRIPLRVAKDKEDIIGYVLKDNILENLVEDKEKTPLKDLKRDIITINEDYNMFSLFSDFIEKREHIALVKDEYGGVSGIVTMEDIIETLLGAEIVDETDNIVNMQNLARKRAKARLDNAAKN